jgi:hypothetical protein
MLGFDRSRRYQPCPRVATRGRRLAPALRYARAQRSLSCSSSDRGSSDRFKPARPAGWRQRWRRKQAAASPLIDGARGDTVERGQFLARDVSVGHGTLASAGGCERIAPMRKSALRISARIRASARTCASSYSFSCGLTRAKTRPIWDSLRPLASREISFRDFPWAFKSWMRWSRAMFLLRFFLAASIVAF